MSSAELREPRCQREIDFRIQVFELHLHPSEPGTDVGSYLLPQIAGTKSAASQNPDEQAKKEDHHDHGSHPQTTGLAPVLGVILTADRSFLMGIIFRTVAGAKSEKGIATALSAAPGLGALKTKTRQRLLAGRPV
jgi:hypothetical protein